MQTATAAEFDPRGPLFAPPFRVEREGEVEVLIDPDRAHWISVNERGRRLLVHRDVARAVPRYTVRALALVQMHFHEGQIATGARTGQVSRLRRSTGWQHSASRRHNSHEFTPLARMSCD